MAGGDDQYPSEVGAEGIDRPQDPIVTSLRPDPAQPPEPVLRMSGFLGDSDRPGFRRLYFTRSVRLLRGVPRRGRRTHGGHPGERGAVLR